MLFINSSDQAIAVEHPRFFLTCFFVVLNVILHGHPLPAVFLPILKDGLVYARIVSMAGICHMRIYTVWLSSAERWLQGNLNVIHNYKNGASTGLFDDLSTI